MNFTTSSFCKFLEWFVNYVSSTYDTEVLCSHKIVGDGEGGGTRADSQNLTVLMCWLQAVNITKVQASAWHNSKDIKQKLLLLRLYHKLKVCVAFRKHT